MEIFQSEDMHLIKIAMSKNSAYDIVFQLSKLGTLQIIDLYKKVPSTYSLHYSKEVLLCNEAE